MRPPRKYLPTLIAAVALGLSLPACGEDFGKEAGEQLNDFGTEVGRGVVNEHEGVGKELVKPITSEAERLAK